MQSEQTMVSVIVPCLNEARTIGAVIEEVRRSLNASRWSDTFEIVVADNGSTDGSAQLASSLGARVIPVSQRGYGSALRAGILAARGNIIVMLDADFTYDASYIPQLIDRLLKGDADLVLGSRLKGHIDPKAMPFLHRAVGTPVLTALVNATWHSTVSDVNSGMRAFRYDSFLLWRPEAEGMEFASEMIVKCLQQGGTLAEVPIRLRADLRERRPHLRRWEDGMRHLLLILSNAPTLFVAAAVGCIGLATLLVLVSVAFGPLRIGRVELFGFHTIIVSVLLGFFGAQSLMQGLILHSNSTPQLWLARRLLTIREGNLFWLLFAAFGITGGSILMLFVLWGLGGFQSLAYVRLSLVFLYVATMLGSLAFGLFNAHIVRRMSKDLPRQLISRQGCDD